MMNKTIAGMLFSLLIASLSLTADEVTNKSSVKRIGTFSSLRYHEEAGDLLGAEIKIVPVEEGSEDRYQGAMQIAQGAPSQLMLVEVKYTHDTIEFNLPKPHEGKFTGIINAKGIVGKIVFTNGAVSKQNLPRKKGYWD